MCKKIFDLPTKCWSITNRKVFQQAVALIVVAILMGSVNIFRVTSSTKSLRNNMLQSISQRITGFCIWNHRKTA